MTTVAACDRERDLVVVADAHVGPDDPELAPFLEFLAARAGDTDRLVLLGDIFSLWLGEEKFTLPHHRAVLDACAALRAGGVRVTFIEGNREFSAGVWRGRAFDEVAESVSAAPWAGRRWLLAHGDLIDPADRRGHAFRALIRSRGVRRAFALLPARAGLAAGARIERALRHRNLPRKTDVPPSRLRDYAARIAARGYDAAVIGHLHVEMTVRDGPGAELFVLPDWRSTHRYLRIPRSGEARFEWHGPATPLGPAILSVRERDGRAQVRLDRPWAAPPGTRVRIAGGHGGPPRAGVVRRTEAGGFEIDLELAPGEPIQAGDRIEPGREG
ncbi:MAG: hypothetical protein D6718_08475 [Acidobacteria bacterium]|nr:MAG: hypothetical protein D6718_08475 [Acidobacteriota bacterium]